MGSVNTNAKAIALDFASISFLATAIRIIIGFPRKIFFALILGTEGFGLIRINDMLMKYSSYFDLGMRLSATRQIPLAQESNSNEELKIIRTIFSWTLLNSFLFVAIVWTLLLSGVDFFGFLTYNNLIIISLSIFLSKFVIYFNSLSKGFGEYGIIGNHKLISSILSPTVYFPLVYFFNVFGFLLSMLILNIFSFAYFSYYLSRTYSIFSNLVISLKDIIFYLKIGFVLWAVQTSQSFFWIIGITLVSFFLTADDVGLYGFAVGVFTIALSLGAPIRTVLFREMLLKKAKEKNSDGNLKTLSKYLKNPFAAYLLVMTISLGVLYFINELLIRLFIQDFTLSIEIIKILIIGYFFFSSNSITNSVLNVADRQSLRLGILTVGLILNLTLGLFSIQFGYGLLGVAWASTVGLYILSFLFMHYSFKMVFGSHKQGFLINMKTTFLFIIIYSVLISLDSWQINIELMAAANLSQVSFFNEIFITSIKIFLFILTTMFLYTLIFYKEKPVSEVFISAKYIFNKSVIKKSSN
tara:strand:+ start:28951 stop:30528 length:1578 start_codon:yes stop_codon:yes gene_type:complete